MRKVTVVTAAVRRGSAPRTVEANLAGAERLLERAGALQADVVCLPEAFLTVGVPYRSAAEVAQAVPGPATTRIGAAARRHGMYVLCPVLEREGTQVFNTAVLLDRAGNVAGSYRKMHPTLGELDRGVTPGDRVQVLETDFGRVAILICFDVNFPQRWQEASDLGAEVVLWATVDEGGLRLAAHARQHEYYIVSACFGPTWRACILDLTGHELAGTSQRDDLAWAQIDLDKRVFHTDHNLERYEAILEKYGRRVTARLRSDDETITLESNDPTLTIEQLMAEFHLEPARAYLQRCAARQEAARLAHGITATWGGRP